MKLRIAAVLSVLMILAAFAFWYKPWAWPGLYDQGVAATICLLYYIVWKGIPDYVITEVGFVGFWFAVNNLVDELFFNPELTGWNEYLFAALILTTTAWRIYQKARK